SRHPDACAPEPPGRGQDGASAGLGAGAWRGVPPPGAGSEVSARRPGMGRVDPSVINKAIKVAVRRAGLTKTLSAHTVRHACATHLRQRGTDIRTIQPRLGHNDLTTTMIYTHILQQAGQGVPSPLDDLGV
ncbi:MAG TPA: tyrosine-type recombinase/integrase, partial [Candidatus Tectomicrobia bacterium]